MRRKSLWIVAAAALMVAAASAVALADFGGNNQNQDVNIIRDPPAGSPCYCPAVWDPVVCKGPDGERHYFSNGCVAGCHGFTHCASVEIRG